MTDIEIAQNSKLKKIDSILNELHVPEEYYEQYGKYKAKISLDYYDKIKTRKNGKLILVTSINPTPLGEGKTTMSIGLSDGINRILKRQSEIDEKNCNNKNLKIEKFENIKVKGNISDDGNIEITDKNSNSNRKCILALREPSLGPVFGIKGGATGGGHSQVAPMEDINLHFTGDIHAITSANNLLSAIIDNHIYHGNELKIKKVTWRRCLDLNDRALREIRIGINSKCEREDHFDISVASEIMAILCLATDLTDLKRRIGNIIVGYNEDDKPVTCKDLKADGSLTVLLKNGINPNVVQTLENNPAIIHGGPFANIAHGCNSIIATKMALKLGEYVVTEAGFGADLGAEKFLNIKCRKLGVSPDAVVIVATLKALKYHGGASKEECKNENIEALKKGINNLRKHIQNINSFGLNAVVAINKFDFDTEKEIEFLKNEMKDLAEVSLVESWGKGGSGAEDLAEKVMKLCEKEHSFKHTYELSDSIKEKIEKVATRIYGAKGVIFSDEAKEEITKLQQNEIANKVPICVAKTQYSLSDDAKNLLCETDFDIHIKSVEYKAGAEFIVVKTGDIMTMPGLPKVPSAEKIDVDSKGNIVGIF